MLETQTEEEAWLNAASFTLSSGQRQGSGFEDSVWWGGQGFCFMFREFLIWSDEAGREASSIGKDQKSRDLERLHLDGVSGSYVLGSPCGDPCFHYCILSWFLNVNKLVRFFSSYFFVTSDAER